MKEKIKLLKIIHIALCLGVSAAYFILGNLQTLDFIKMPALDTSTLIYLLIVIAAIFIGNFLFKKQLRSVDRKIPLENKFNTYLNASMIRWAVIEGAAFFIIFTAKEFLLIGIFLILYMVFLRPSEETMENDFKLYS